jgi:hypothetical protein
MAESDVGKKQRLIAQLKEKLADLQERKAEQMEFKAEERENKANAAVAALETVASQAMHPQVATALKRPTQLSKLAQIQAIEEGFYKGMPTPSPPPPSPSPPPPTPPLQPTAEDLDRKKAAEQVILQKLILGDSGGSPGGSSRVLERLRGEMPTLAPTTAEFGYKMKQEHNVAMQIAALNTPELALKRELAREQVQSLSESKHTYPENAVPPSTPAKIKPAAFVSERFVPGGLAGLAMREHTTPSRPIVEPSPPTPSPERRPVLPVTKAPTSRPVHTSTSRPVHTPTRLPAGGRFDERSRVPKRLQQGGHKFYDQPSRLHQAGSKQHSRFHEQLGGRFHEEQGQVQHGRLHEQQGKMQGGQFQAEAKKKERPTLPPTRQPTWGPWKSKPMPTKHCKQIGIKGHWSECSAVCGVGWKKRFYGQIKCVKRQKFKVETVQSVACTGDFTGCKTPIFTRILLPPLRGFRDGS